MCFYDALQLDPAVLKDNIKNSNSKKEKGRFLAAIIIRDILLVAFSIVFISVLSSLFGSENSCMAVVIFCILLSVRFIDFGYNAAHSVINLAVVFSILLIAPIISQLAGPFTGLFINIFAILTMVIITCDSPEMGNGGLYLFGYIFLTGNTVSGHSLLNRFFLTVTGYIICALVLFFKHRNKNSDISFSHIVKKFSLYDPKCRWQLQLSFGISILFFINSFFNISRFMWIGFACSSLLSSYPIKASERFVDRALGIVLGSAFFGILYRLTPDSLLFLFGPVSGLCLGFCSQYRTKKY